MKGFPPNLIADVTLYPTSHGGRQHPIVGEWFGCPCKVNKDDFEAWDCRVLLDGRSMMPGESRRVGMLFLSGEQVAKLFRAAGKFYLWEGHVIGEAKVVLD